MSLPIIFEALFFLLQKIMEYLTDFPEVRVNLKKYIQVTHTCIYNIKNNYSPLAFSHVV